MRFGSVSLLAAAALALASCGRGGEDPARFAEEQAKAADFFLKSNARADDVHVTASGLQYKVLASGPAGGARPDINDLVSLHYEGSLTDGSVFDSSFDRGQPFITAPEGLNGSPIIPAWTEALQLMRPGDEWIVYAPPALGYGERGAGAQIPPNAVLVFRIKVLDVQPVPGALRTILPRDAAYG